MIKNVLMEVRDIDFSKFEELSVEKIFEILDSKKINSICRSITGSKTADYANDLLGEEGAIEVISDFLLNIVNSYEKSKNFKSLIQTFLSPKIREILNKATLK